jgi:hypothetical protein
MDQAGYYWGHPPRCVAGFTARPAVLPRVVFDGHGEDLNTVFLLACTCGHEHHYVLGHYWRNPEFNNVLVFLSPLALRCASCGKVTELIDTDRHGYDAEIGAIVATKRGEGERAECQCEACGPQAFQVCVRFEYSDYLFDRDFAESRGKEQELFSWFSVVGKCPGCSRLLSITDFECA